MVERTAQTHNHGYWGAEEKGTEKGKGRLAKECLFMIRPFVWMKWFAQMITDGRSTHAVRRHI